MFLECSQILDKTHPGRSYEKGSYIKKRVVLRRSSILGNRQCVSRHLISDPMSTRRQIESTNRSVRKLTSSVS